MNDRPTRSQRSDDASCPYCGCLGWTVEHYGRITHKQSCPHRTDPWHQGDPHPEKGADARLHKWGKAPRSLFATFVCAVCGCDSMVKHYGRCSGGR